MNISDSERLASILAATGFTATADWQEADLLIFNTCKIRQSAEDRVFGQQEQIRALRQQKPGLVFAITGCMIHHTSFANDPEKSRDPLFARMRVLDFVFRIDDSGKLPELLKRYFPFAADIASQADYFALTPKVSNRFQVLVPIMSGCNKFCTYCVVPFTRGQERCRQHTEIVREIEQLVARGALEVTLLGQNVNSYWDSQGTTFPQLLELVQAIPGLERIRFSTSHPYDLSAELIAVMAKSPKICKELHLPIQHGDDAVLRLMKRHYSVAAYLAIITKARQAMPNLTVSTDIIVGFPGETEAAFPNSLKLYKEVAFDLAYIAQFSPRSGTPAAIMPHQVDEATKKRRWDKLNQLMAKVVLKKNQNYLGTAEVVLVETVQAGIASGRTEGFKYTQFPLEDMSIQPGDLVTVKIDQALTWVLRGRPVSIKKGPRSLRGTKTLPLVASKKLNSEISLLTH